MKMVTIKLPKWLSNIVLKFMRLNWAEVKSLFPL